jgi:hypothetical protein
VSSAGVFFNCPEGKINFKIVDDEWNKSGLAGELAPAGNKRDFHVTEVAAFRTDSRRSG